MGVKSTIDLGRREAEELYVRMKMEDEALQRVFRAEAVLLSNTDLEDALEALNDATYSDGMGGFDNYMIVKE